MERIETEREEHTGQIEAFKRIIDNLNSQKFSKQNAALQKEISSQA
jgi:hypothetical protein